jgi:hypothetical protein
LATPIHAGFALDEAARLLCVETVSLGVQFSRP